MKIFVRSVLALLSLSCVANAAEEDWPELNLTQEILEISLIAANLSVLAFAENTTEFAAVGNLTSGEAPLVEFEHPDYDEINFYAGEPDQAIVAKKGGRCYLAFRGTTVDFADWSQNAGLGNEDIYRDNNVTTGEFCEARGGFTDFIRTEPVARGLADLEACIATCEDKDDCLVITGHGQGGAVAAIASIGLYRHNPIVITYGQPPTLNVACPYIRSNRYYRYVNSMKDIDGENVIKFDLVVVAPTFVSQSVHYGYFILLSEDKTAVKYFGFNNDYDFRPNIADSTIAAHTVSGTLYSYETRIANLLTNVPITMDGFGRGNICETGYSEICASEACVEFSCIPVGGVQELCVLDSCEADDDCAGTNICIWDSCAAGDGMVNEGCPCASSSDCKNDICETISTFRLDYRCTIGGTKEEEEEENPNNEVDNGVDPDTDKDPTNMDPDVPGTISTMPPAEGASSAFGAGPTLVQAISTLGLLLALFCK
jgi:hypothetical protein